MIENTDIIYYNLPQKTQLFLKAWFLKDINRQSLVNLIRLLHLKKFLMCFLFEKHIIELLLLSFYVYISFGCEQHRLQFLPETR